METRVETGVAQDVDQLAINTIRFLAVDMVEKANSGHPGAPLGLAPLAYVLWTRYLRHDPEDPDWPGRDRFVLSAGHASALLYALLHLCGYDLPMSELQRFRQLGSRTPGHPEHELTRGVETTTGPLGQGMGNSVGMAIAARKAAAAFNRDGFPLFDSRVWVVASDGDMMEGISSEVSSLAGHLRLGNLKVFYDDNAVSLDGPTSLSFSDDVGKRYEAYGWRIERVADGNDLAALGRAIAAVEAESERPSLVLVRTVIGYGSPKKQGTSAAHGSPLGKDETIATKQALGWPLEPAFYVPEEARSKFAEVGERGRRLRADWQDLLRRYEAAHPDAAADLAARLAGRLPDGWQEALPSFSPADAAIATRAASGKVLNAIAPRLPQLVGGSADLSTSNDTMIKGEPNFARDQPGGRNFFFGVREHGMGSILSGIALSRLWIPYGGTFLIFSDYMRPPIRLAAMMKLQVIYVYTHDSIFLGEDGPTHEPIEQLAGLRAIPGMTVIRPADACETAAAWRTALEHRDGPTALVLTRQNLPILEETQRGAPAGVPRGAYVLSDPPGGGEPDILLLATGSEVSLIHEAGKRLAGEGIKARLVSMPSWELFDRQPAEYRDQVLPPAVRRRLAVEAAGPLGWHKYVGDAGQIHCMRRFGASAPAKALAQEFGYTPENVAALAREMLGGQP
ncbi:MAG TPA: transketolase [Thermoanaerobaculia bacterium]|nr:transketolase [Thermoanaerobaculia bacterium]